MNSDQFVMSTESFEAFTAIERRFELIEGEKLRIWDHCDSICVDWSRFGYVGDEFEGQ